MLTVFLIKTHKPSSQCALNSVFTRSFVELCHLDTVHKNRYRFLCAFHKIESAKKQLEPIFNKKAQYMVVRTRAINSLSALFGRFAVNFFYIFFDFLARNHNESAAAAALYFKIRSDSHNIPFKSSARMFFL